MVNFKLEHKCNFMGGQQGLDPALFGVGMDPGHFRSLMKSEILLSKRVMQKCRVQTVM